MLKVQILLLLLVFLGSCKKEQKAQPPGYQPSPKMEYINLGGREAGFNMSQHIDLDKDGNRDFSFVTLHIGDPVLNREIIQFSASSTIDRFLLLDDNDNTPVFNKGDTISFIGKPGYQWNHVALTPLSEKIIEGQKPVFWTGAWKNTVNKYMAFQSKKNGFVYNGWFELSMDTIKEKIIIHRAAICKEPATYARAGY